METTLTKEEEELLTTIENHDGLEVHRANWPVAERLEARGLITLGAVRGPGDDWRRAEIAPPAGL